MASQQQQKQRVVDLLHANVKAKSISDIVGVSLKTVTTENGIKKSDSGGSNKKTDPDFLTP